MEWYEEYNIGVDLIDHQHRELFKRVSRLQEALSSGAVNSEIAEMLKFLVAYTNQHFQDEEKVMASIAFAELANHRKMHENLTTDVRNILIDLKKGKKIHPYELIDFLSDWLLNHIRYEDKKIGRALDERQRQRRTWDGSFA
ncbi:MAG: hemerythrin [Desulfobulbaceae bacterium]|nr:MAG: hemerythrin [Desulfobulbaceae bacterium]